MNSRMILVPLFLLLTDHHRNVATYSRYTSLLPPAVVTPPMKQVRFKKKKRQTADQTDVNHVSNELLEVAAQRRTNDRDATMDRNPFLS